MSVASGSALLEWIGRGQTLGTRDVSDFCSFEVGRIGDSLVMPGDFLMVLPPISNDYFSFSLFFLMPDVTSNDRWNLSKMALGHTFEL